MGLLDNIFGGGGNGGGGGPSKLALAAMAMLAYRAYQNRGGGLSQDSRYGSDQRGGTGPVAADPASGGGGLGSILGSLLGGSAPQRGAAPTGAPGAGGLGSILGGMLGGAATGTFLNGGLNDLLRRFQQNGMGQAADSWVGHGTNHPVRPEEVEKALGRDTLEQLSHETGRPYTEVLSELSKSLPDTVDKLTPDGRIPTEHEASRW